MSTLNVFRYTALASGILYGAYHASQLKAAAQKAEEASAFAKKEALIAEAKQKYAELTKKDTPVAPVAAATTPAATATEINFDDDKLDFAQVILAAVENLKN